MTAYKTKKPPEMSLLNHFGVTVEKIHKPGKATSVQRYTPYEAVRLLFAHPVTRALVMGRTRYADLMAGDGAMYRHFRGASFDRAVHPGDWTLADIQPSQRLLDLRPHCTVINPADLFTDIEPDESMDAHITNWPWYGWNRHFERVRELYPNALIGGISCDQERRDCGRAEWWKNHAPSLVAALPGRTAFPTPGETTSGNYPYTVSWYFWLPQISNSEHTRTIYL